MGTWANVNTIQPLPPKKPFIALLTVREDDVGHSTKRVVKVGLLGDVDITAFELDTDSDHGNHYGRKDTDEGYFCSLGHFDISVPKAGRNRTYRQRRYMSCS